MFDHSIALSFVSKFQQARTSKQENHASIKFMSESEVDLLSIKKVLSSDSDSNSGDDDNLPLTELKKRTNSAKKSA